MHDHILSNKQYPIQKFHKNLKNPKNFQNPQNLGLKCMNAWEKRDLRHIPNDLILVGVEKAVGVKIFVREKCLEGEKRFFVERDVRKVNLISCLVYI